MSASQADHNDTFESKLSDSLRRWRWQIPLALFGLVLLHQVAEHTVLQGLARWQHFASQLLFYGLTGPLLAWWAVNSLYRGANEIEHTQRDLEEAHKRLRRANERLSLLIQVNRRLADAQDEDEVVDVILDLPRAVVPALGSSLVQFEENQRCTVASYCDELDETVVASWASQLTDGELRRSCRNCVVRHAHDPGVCPILNRTSDYLPSAEAVCFPLQRGDHKFAMLNVYLPAGCTLAQRQWELLMAMADEMSLALEGHQLRSREMQMLYRLREAQTTTNLNVALAEMLDEIVAALEVDGGMLYLSEIGSSFPRRLIESGKSIGRHSQVVQGLALGMKEDDKPVVIGEITQSESGGEIGSLVIAPMRVGDTHVGAFVLWDGRREAFGQRQVKLIAALAGQAGLLIEHNRLYTNLEHKAALAERTRLAREIHDGLSQTLGFLKLRTVQIEKWLRAGDYERAGAGLRQMGELAADAYLDAREAIDGLSVQPAAGDLSAWLAEVLEDFRTLCDIEIESEPPPAVELPAEVHAQLMRITQEALGNVRKHAHATRVSLLWALNEEGLTLRILDNGQGFALDDVPPLSRHGLRIMQERAQLLAADVQIDSRPNHGTQVTVRLPLFSFQQAAKL